MKMNAGHVEAILKGLADWYAQSDGSGPYGQSQLFADDLPLIEHIRMALAGEPLPKGGAR